MPLRTAHSLFLISSFAIVVANMLCGCAAPTPPASITFVEVPKAFKAQVSSPPLTAQAPTIENWWLTYADPVLEDLVDRANKGNTSIQAAAARLTHAKAMAHQSQSARAPLVALNAGATRQQGPLLNAAGQEGTLLTVGSNVSYEMDVWGRLAQAGDAASLDAESRASLLQSAQLLTQAHVVQTYLSLRAIDEDIALVEQAIRIGHDALQISEYRYSAGSISEFELERLRGETGALSLEALTLKNQRAELENALASLLGEPASNFQLPPTTWISKLPPVQSAMPATVVARRPDVASAHKLVLAAQKRLGVAQSAWLPNVALTGAVGYASPDMGSLLSASMQTLVFGALSTLPLFDGGRKESGIAMADAELSAAVTGYKEQILVALREVEDQLTAFRLLEQKRELTNRAWKSTERKAELSASRYRNGLISQLELLESQRLELLGRRNVLQVRSSQYQVSVALVRAVGGGWN